MLPLWVSVVAATALAAPAPGTREQKLQVAQAPNVVLVASDSFDGRLTFQPGSRVVKLPFINFMKAHGTTFLNAYTNSPICCPSRAAMWSGLFTHLTESWNNFKGLDPNYTTWMDVMEKHGYQTQKFGKLDYTSGHHSVRPFRGRLTYSSDPLPLMTAITGFPDIQPQSQLRQACLHDCPRFPPDHGEIILALRKLDLLQKTIVIYTSDHGEMAMEHRQFYKMSMYEASAHVPLLMMGPGIKVNLQVPDFVSLVDIYPTMLDIAGLALPQTLSGYSLLGLSSETSANEQTFKIHRPPWILSEFHGCNVNASTYMLRTGQWKYIAYSDGASVQSQLFDLSSDPDELTNIATEFPEITYSLDQKLRSIINYPKVSASVHQYNREQFIMWKQSVGQNYSAVIAHLRWHQDWQKEPWKYEKAIHQWLTAHSSPRAVDDNKTLSRYI
ncbi:arylsulfatase K isoform X4 [Peromyscus californicus insignis]|uniref:arylsulfatase K isoform X4 n=1 Tax=Peromyscus californicus insignis TaxID=564181 RepID=UPI0022A6E928|nr:arylsulfatase K isoform X4 [Peromyscus californicus insignis]